MSTQQAPAPRRSHLALIVSLCLNLILFGIVAAAVLRFAFMHPMMGEGPDHHRLAPQMLMVLVPAEAPKIQAIMSAHESRLDALHRAAMAARHDTMAAFAAPDFTPQTFEAALGRLRGADAALEAEELALVSQSVAALTSAERQSVVERMRAHRGFAMHRHRGPGF